MAHAAVMKLGTYNTHHKRFLAVHTKHCKKRPKQAKNNLLNYFSKNTDFDTEVVTDGTDQVVEVANIDIDDENNEAELPRQ